MACLLLFKTHNYMENKNQNIIYIILGVLFLMVMINTCNSCSASRKADEIIAAQKAMSTHVDDAISTQSKAFDLSIQLVQPQIVSQFLTFLGSEKYKSEIQLNNEKINALNLQLKNIKLKNDTIKKH